MAQNNTPVVGGSCTVTEGTHKGKKGTYSRDDDGVLWCDVDGGSTDCTGGKCADARANLHVRDFADASGVGVYEVTGLVEVPGRGIFDVSTLIEADTGRERRVSVVPVAAVRLDSLRKSSSDAERHAAAVLERHFDVALGNYGTPENPEDD